MTGKFNLYPFKVGQVLVLKKTHPCGNNIWDVKRVGQEIAIKCQKCGHQTVMPRRTLEKSIKKIGDNPQ